ncbi:hypothetical protein ACFSJY_19000 [Thalassotalea euphylliae]|uniref:ligand-binding sensor domain-containing protein n=1 Tax=Thalassotalea euphylliae TaxID=1655234 RepID=UPI00363C3DB3
MITIKIKRSLIPSCKRFAERLCLFPLLIAFHSYGLEIRSTDSLVNVNDIHQDREGYIWLGGQHGLTRYDGTEFINFSTQHEHWRTSFNWVYDIDSYQDSLLVASQPTNFWRLNLRTGESSSIEVPGIKNSYIGITQFKQHFYFDAEKKLYQKDIETGAVNIINSEIVIRTITSSKRFLYVLTDEGIYKLENNQLVQVLSGNFPAFVSFDNGVIAYEQGKLHRIYDDGRSSSINAASTIQRLATFPNQEKVAAIDLAGNIAIFSVAALDKLPHSYPSYQSATIRKLFVDNSGVIWLASNHGVTRLKETYIQNTPKVYDVQYNAHEIIGIDDEIIVATYGDGFHSLNNSTKFIDKQSNDNLTKNAKRIMSILRKGDQLITGTFDGIWQYDLNLKQATKLNFQGNDNLVLKLVEDNGLLFIGTNANGLKILDWRTNRVVATVDEKNGLKHKEVIDILPKDNGDIWLATSNNVEIYNLNTKRVKQTNIDIVNKVISLVPYEDKIYAFTKGSGILVFDLNGELLTHLNYTMNFSTGELINGEIWVSATPGLYKLNPENNQVSLVPGSEEYSLYGSPLQINNNIHVWHFGGLLTVSIDAEKDFQPNIVISTVNISGTPQLNADNLKLTNSNEVVSFNLASLDYRSGIEKQFRYKINSGNWLPINGNQLILTGLSSGTYDLSFRGTNSLGQWSEKQAFARIEVEYPWYWTLRMRVLYAVTLVCLISLIGWLFYLRTQSIRKIHLFLENELQRKGKRALSTKRNLQSILSMMDVGDIDGAKAATQQCIDEYEDSSSSDTPDDLYGKSLSVAIPYLTEYLHSKYHVNLEFDVSEEVERLPYELQANIYKVIFEAISCAIHHGDGRNFQLTIQEFKEKLWLTITDDESSFSDFNNKVTFNMSMYYIRQIASKYNASINTFEPSGNKGSQIVISFPLV